MKKQFSQFSLLVIGVLIMLVSQPALCDSLENSLKGMAAYVSQSLPMKVSADVQATSVVAVGNRILYKYNYLRSAATLDARQLKVQHSADAVAGMCTNPTSLKLLRQGAILAYEFYDATNVHLFEFSVTQRDCTVYR